MYGYKIVSYKAHLVDEPKLANSSYFVSRSIYLQIITSQKIRPSMMLGRIIKAKINLVYQTKTANSSRLSNIDF